jgi:hypothetical protein
MTAGFGSIPPEVIDFIRQVFARANDKVSSALTVQPATPEESLDNLLVNELRVTPPTFFATSKAGVVLESHWLGKRRMYRSWEVADIAFLISVRQGGKLVARKVTLLQTKRLYAKELAGTELERYDYEIGIGRLIDRIEDTVPLFPQRAFRFTPDCKYEVLLAEANQVEVIEAYAESRQIEVFYGLYNPVTLPFTGKYPWDSTAPLPSGNTVGCRVLPSKDVHSVLAKKAKGQSPTYSDLTFKKYFKDDGVSGHGWRLENFVADEVMKCHRGRLFTQNFDDDLRGLLYGRTAPISSAIAITIDLAAEG